MAVRVFAPPMPEVSQSGTLSIVNKCPFDRISGIEIVVSSLGKPIVMRIGIEAQRVFRKKKGGMDVVALEIIKSLQELDKTNEYIIYTSQGEDVGILQETANFKIKYLKGFTYFDWEQWQLPKQAQKDEVDLLHCTSNTAPLWGAFKKVVTVHDIMYLEKQTWPSNANWYQKLGNYYRSFIVPRVVRKADKILTVSHFERDNMLRYFQMPATKIEVVSNGVNTRDFYPISDPVVLDRVRQKYKLPTSYLFFLGNTEPRKNLRNVLKAYALVTNTLEKVPSLAITNVKQDFLAQVIEELGLKHITDRILLLGYVDFKDLPVLYNMATCYLYPSLREGFGLPIVEAMACGTAVITSNTSSMPEIAGDAALLVDPTHAESIAQAIRSYVEDPSLVAQKTTLGNEQYKKYTWKASAEKLIGIYKTVVRNSPNG